MSAFGPKRTSATALQMSAFGGKAEIELTRCHGRLSVYTARTARTARVTVQSGGPDARTTDEASRSYNSGAPQRRRQVRRRVGAGDSDEVSRGQLLQAPGRRNLRLRPRGRIEDDADLDERTAGAGAQTGIGSTTIGLALGDDDGGPATTILG